MNGADHLCDVLLANDVDVCFANPGTSEMHFVAALDAKPRMRCILGLFEGVVTGAADGYARMRDWPAATLLHTGPGLANGLANMHNARRARVPMINIVGDHARHHLAFDAPLTTDIEGLARPMSDWVRRAQNADDIGLCAESAILASLTPPGIATLILPADAAWGKVTGPKTRRVSVPTARVSDWQHVDRIGAALKTHGPRVGFLLSGSALRGAGLRAAGRIAHHIGAQLFCPVLAARLERGNSRVPVQKIPYPVDAALTALKDLRLLVLVGASPPVAFFAYPGKPSSLLPSGCECMTLAEHGDDLCGALEALASTIGATGIERATVARAPGTEGRPSGVLTEDAIALTVAQLLPDNAIVVDEALTSARRFFALTEGGVNHDYLMVPGGSIGSGIPLSVGSAIACPDRKVVNLQADGSGMYTLQGLWTAAREHLNMVTVIFSNRAYAILQGEMRNVGVDKFGVNADRMLRIDEPALDWVKLSQGMGVEAVKVKSVDKFADAFKAACLRRDPFLIEALI